MNENPYEAPEGEGYGMPPTSPLTYDKATGLGETHTTGGETSKVSSGGFEIPTVDRPVREPVSPSRQMTPLPQAQPITPEGPYTVFGLPWYYWVAIAAAGYFTYRYFFTAEEKKKRKEEDDE